MSFERWDVCIVPFPFVDIAVSKRRPVVILSTLAFNQRHDHVVAAMVTTAASGGWPSDVPLVDLPAAGLRHDCVLRWKVFSVDKTLVGRRLGSLGPDDRPGAERGLREMIIP